MTPLLYEVRLAQLAARGSIKGHRRRPRGIIAQLLFRLVRR